jgi:hypothetical protein
MSPQVIVVQVTPDPGNPTLRRVPDLQPIRLRPLTCLGTLYHKLMKSWMMTI